MSRLIDANDFANRMYHEAFVKNTDMQRWDSGCWIRYRLFENVLSEQPTVQPERKRGEWIVWGGMDIPENHGRHICSLCGEFAPVRCEKPLIKEYLSDFCPNCGADMRGGDAE